MGSRRDQHPKIPTTRTRIVVGGHKLKACLDFEVRKLDWVMFSVWLLMGFRISKQTCNIAFFAEEQQRFDDLQHFVAVTILCLTCLILMPSTLQLLQIIIGGHGIAGDHIESSNASIFC